MDTSPPIPPIDWTLLEKVLAGTASPAEQRVADTQLRAHPEVQDLLDTLEQDWLTPPRIDSARPALESLAALTRQIDADDQSQQTDAERTVYPSTDASAVHTPVMSFPRSLANTSFHLSASAWAGVVGLALGALLVFMGWQSGERSVSTQIASHVSAYTTANGQQATITLPDGSKAILNVGSRLEVPANFGAGNRTLTLTGEALFTVVHHTNSPFTIISGPHRTRVLGTTFVVRRYVDDQATTVSVRDGKVALDTVILAANQRVIVGAGGTERSTADVEDFSFTTGVLTLNGVLLPDAIASLNRWYDADIRLGDPALATLRLKGRLAIGSIGDLASLLDQVFNVRVVRDDRTLTLYPRP